MNKEEGLIYILYPRACKNCNENVYKIGKTKNYKQRLSKYTKGSKYILVIKVDDYHNIETKLLQLCRLKFTERKDYGNEYFESNRVDIISLVKEITHIKEIIIEEVNNKINISENINDKLDNELDNNELDICMKNNLDNELDNNELDIYMKNNLDNYINYIIKK